ncbi:MAG: hypothetical protein GY828_06980 [Candidatus Gracilibacteria bacterium]|nr:hypothetical protein [Candidatus Gracilibacteria bacterium]
MFTPKAAIFDRLDQTIELMKKNLFGLVLPLFLFNFIFFGIILLFFMSYVSNILGDLTSLLGDDFFQTLYSAGGVLIIAIGIFLGLLYSLLYIPILIGSIRSIHQTAQGEEITMTQNVLFGFKNIFTAFKTYWYIFKYVFLLPALIFIVGGLMFNSLYIFDIGGNMGELIKTVSIFVMSLSFFIFIVFLGYRGIRSNFVLYSAVVDQSFTQENFDTSVKTTEGKFWRIWGNFILTGFILFFVSGFIGNTLGVLLPDALNIDASELMSEESIGNLLSSEGIGNLADPKNMNLESILNILPNGVNKTDGLESIDLDSINISFSWVKFIISAFFEELLASIFSVFTFVFTYIFMKRLKLEKNENIK